MPEASLTKKLEDVFGLYLSAESFALNQFKGHAPQTLTLPRVHIVDTGGDEIEQDTGIYKRTVMIEVSRSVDADPAVEGDAPAVDHANNVATLASLVQKRDLHEALNPHATELYIYQAQDKGSEPNNRDRILAEVFEIDVTCTPSNLQPT